MVTERTYHALGSGTIRALLSHWAWRLLPRTVGFPLFDNSGPTWLRPAMSFMQWRVVEHPGHVKRMQHLRLPTRSTLLRPN